MISYDLPNISSARSDDGFGGLIIAKLRAGEWDVAVPTQGGDLFGYLTTDDKNRL
jgi:hypothetical protein